MTQDTERFRRRARHVLVAWLALIALMLTSLGSAYLRLGPWNPVAGLVIAAIKSSIVMWLFMGLVRAGALLRIVAAAGVAMLALLFGLSGVDYATRVRDPAVMQPPQHCTHPRRVEEPAGTTKRASSSATEFAPSKPIASNVSLRRISSARTAPGAPAAQAP
jgi:cytochrome c oxidase subunit IV